MTFAKINNIQQTKVLHRLESHAYSEGYDIWLFRPGRWLTIYLLATVVLFVLSPFGAYYIDLFGTVVYSVIVWLCFYWGQRNGVYSNVQTGARHDSEPFYINMIMSALSAYTIIIIVALLASYGYDLQLDTLQYRLLNPGEAYFDKFLVADVWKEQSNFLMQLYTLTNALVLLVIPLTFWYWHVLGWPIRLLCVGAIITRLIPGIMTGTMVDVGLVAVEVSVSVMALGATGRISKEVTRKLGWIAVVSGLFFVFFAISTLLGRADARSWSPWEGGQLWYYNPENLLTSILGPRLAFGVYLLINYVTHGYEGLGQCLQLPFVWTYGIGHSRALMEYADQYLGWDWIWDRHYLWRNYLVTGRHPLMYWPTALVWIASDVTFWGVPLVIFLIGRFFGKIWKEFLLCGNPITLALFIRLVILVLFLPANFQIFQGRVMWWGTMGLLALWLVSKRNGKALGVIGR